jgi:hypothetical protein
MIGKLYVPGKLLALVKSAVHCVLKYGWAVAPLVEVAPEVKVTSLFVSAAYVPPEPSAHCRSLTGFTPAPVPTKVQFVALPDLIFSVQLRFALIVNVGPASGPDGKPKSMSSAVGAERVVVVEVMPSLTRLPTATEAV